MFAFEELKEKFLNIPEDVREAISSNEVNEKLLSLADKYKLQYDETDELTKEIGYIMLGLKPKDNFVQNIQKVTQLDSEKSKALAEEINSSIFENIRESLRKIHEQRETKEEEDEDLDEHLVREELLNELSLPKEKSTDLMKLPSKEIIKPQTEIIEPQTEIIPKTESEKLNEKLTLKKEIPLNEVGAEKPEIPVLNLDKNGEINTTQTRIIEKKKETEQSTPPTEQEKPKSYTIDPYREPLD
ncbi:hypothetical protein KKH36_00940 [Patescibacteria group bacterium]|nr:hypothetical protein [Patescibacteria group bacterium]